MKKITCLAALFFVAQSSLFSQTTAIPDVNFENALIFFGIDTNGATGDILNADAAGEMAGLSIVNHFNIDMSVNGGRITDFTGIEAFVNITTLNLSYNDMTSLNLAANTLLTTINVEGSANLTTLTLTGLTILDDLQAKQCALTALDTSTLAALTILNVRQNSLAGVLDLHLNGSLVVVDCSRQSSPTYDTLTGIDMANGNNVNVTSFDSDFNGAASSINVDDASEYPAGYLMDGGNWSKDFNSTYISGGLGTDDNIATLFRMYPNPAKGYVFIASKSQVSVMDVYSITGKLVLTKALSFGDNSINISSLSSGVYLAKFSSENRSETKKLIVQ